jgi:tetratricopeptide (TPR) repeat protein
MIEVRVSNNFRVKPQKYLCLVTLWNLLFMSQNQLQSLLAQKKYRQAIAEISKIQRSQPDLVFNPSEAEIWRLRGQQELEKSEFKAAENSFRQSLRLGLTTEVYYWLAKTLLSQNRLDAALNLIKDAFESKTLPKDDGICYLKLLMLKGDRAIVESLINTHAKRFSAAQLNWAKGVLELQSGDPKSAIAHLSKLKTPLTPGDSIEAWIAYTLQQQGNWDAAAMKLGLLGLAGLSLFGKPKFVNHPAMQKLAILQQAVNGDAHRAIDEKTDRANQEILTALSVVKLMAEGNFHDAGHALLQIKSTSTQIAELMALKSTILTIAGEQAMNQGASECAVKLWQPLLQEQELNPQLVVNFVGVLDDEGEYQERQRLLTRFIKWIEQDANRNHPAWPEERLKNALAHAHCLIADCFIGLSRYRAAWGAVEQAARICPTSPEVIGRQGLMAILEGKSARGIELLTQALEQGCQYDQVYEALQETLSAENRENEAAEIRKRHGKNFGDLPVAAEVTVEPWIDALSARDYASFSSLIPKAKATEPTLRACQIFQAAAYGKLTGTGKTSIHQAQATAAWDRLLDGLTPDAKLSTLQVIALLIEVLAKRDKGIAALSTRYMVKIPELIPEIPAARAIHLIVLAVKENKPDKLQFPLKAYLDAAPQPDNALALLQLQVRWFAQTVSLRSFIETALSHDSQNPLLLLAKATTFSPSSQPYQQFRSAGFELARRLQDPKALEAFRMEDRYLNQQKIQSFMPMPGRVDIEMPPEVAAAFEEMIRRTLGSKVSRAELDLMMPMLKRKFIADMLNNTDDGFADDEEDDDFDDFANFDDIFGSSRSKKRKRSFMDL